MRKVFQQAENLASIEKTNTQHESFKRFLNLGQSYIYYLDKNSAIKAFESRKISLKIGEIEKILVEIVAFDLEDPVWEKKLLQKKNK